MRFTLGDEFTDSLNNFGFVPDLSPVPMLHDQDTRDSISISVIWIDQISSHQLGLGLNSSLDSNSDSGPTQIMTLTPNPDSD